MQVQHEAAQMILEKRLLQRRNRVKQENSQEGRRARKKMNVKKWLQRKKSLADVTKQLQVTARDTFNLHLNSRVTRIECLKQYKTTTRT